MGSNPVPTLKGNENKYKQDFTFNFHHMTVVSNEHILRVKLTTLKHFHRKHAALENTDLIPLGKYHCTADLLFDWTGFNILSLLMIMKECN